MDELRNIGPASAERLKSVGIETTAQLESLGAVAAYRRVKDAFPEETSFNLLYALEGALRDMPWDLLPPRVRDELRAAAESL